MGIRSVGPWLLVTALIVAGVVASLLGWQAVGFGILALALVALLVASSRTRRPHAPLPALDPEQAADIRAERERSGEVAAVRRLRRQRPELGLADAVRLVRDLEK
jgi:membrane protein implicated in regulation of membrane protease activity